MMDTRKLRPDFRPQVVEHEVSRVEALQDEQLYLPPFAADSYVWLEGVEDDISWFELVLYWLGEIGWWRRYWSRPRN
ncbi:MAG: hypothetical protein ACK2T2_05090 [Anaerolineales bacterium]|jgi:hypothetical protein